MPLTSSRAPLSASAAVLTVGIIPSALHPPPPPHSFAGTLTSSSSTIHDSPALIISHLLQHSPDSVHDVLVGGEGPETITGQHTGAECVGRGEGGMASKAAVCVSAEGRGKR